MGMSVRPEFQSRDRLEVVILEALADRRSDGMTVFELRSHVDRDIDELEAALADLKDDGLIAAEENGGRTVIIVEERVIPDEPVEADEITFIDALLDRFRR